MKVREAGRIVPVAVTLAVAVNDQGRREVPGMAVGASEAETFWLARRGLRGVKLVVCDDHKDLKAAVTRILGATWQRCRVHFTRNLLAHAGKQGRRVVSAFAQDDAASAKAQWRLVADPLRPKVPKLAAIMDEAEHDVLASMTFSGEHRQKLHSTNPLERLNAEIKRRTNVVGVRRAVRPPEGTLFPPHSPTRTPSPDWSARSFSNRTANGASHAPVSDNLNLMLPAVAA